MEENKMALEKALKKLDREQMVQIMWIAVARAAPFHKKDFLKEVNKNGYLTLLFLSIETCRALCVFKSLNFNNNSALFGDSYPVLDHILTFIHNRTRNNRARTFTRGRILAQAIERVLDRTFALYLTLGSGGSRVLDRALKSDPRFIFNYNLALDPDQALDYASNLTLDLALYLKKIGYKRYYDLLIEDASLICENCNEKLNNDTAWYGGIWEEWLNTLRELGGGYWADWYERLFKNRFKITEEGEVKRHLSLPKELWDEDLNVSAQWLIKLAQPDAKHVNEARIILLGEKGAGKTSLARRLVKPDAHMPTKEESTEGVDVTNVKLSMMAQGIPRDRDANVHIWDFAGHAITHAAHRFFLSERCLYIIVYDGRTEGRNRLGYWLDHVRNYGGKSRVIVLVNLQDEHKPDIPETYFMERYADNQCEFIRFSIKDDKAKLQSFRETLANIIADDPAWDQRIPADYYDVKQQIEKEFTKEHRNHITRQEFDRVAINIEKAEREILLKSLTCLGICLWYPEIEGIDLLVLNPEWITRGIYRIVNWLRESGRPDASVKLNEFQQVFKTIENDYPKDKHPFLYQIMQKYELAYKKAYCEEIVVPQCLPEDCPKKAELPGFPQETSLYIEIIANKSGSEGPRLTFPPDVLPRFIVRRSDDLKNCPIWRYGAVLKKGNVTALIEQEDFLIQLRVNGRERRDYLGELLYTLMAVLNGYPSFALEKPEISCCITASDGSSREMIPLTHVFNLVRYMERKNKVSYIDYTRNMEIPLENAKMYLSPKINDYLESGDVAKIMEGIERISKANYGNTFNLNGGQFNITTNGGSITATQNNGINADELMRLINNLKAAIPEKINEEDKKTVDESLAAVEEELKKEKPRKSVIKTLLTGLKGIISTAEFAAAVAGIITFVGTL